MVARATAPNRIGPESVFPDAGQWDFQQGLKGSPMASAPFWVALICQLIIVIGYFWFYRKEQLGTLIDLLCGVTLLTCAPSTPMMSVYLLHLAGIEFNFGNFWVVVAGHCIFAFC